MRRGAGLILLLAAAVMAQPPQMKNAQLETRTSQGLEGELKTLLASTGVPLWLGYSVEKAAGSGSHCCCWQEGSKGTVYLEGSRAGLVMLRLENGQVSRAQAASQGCEIDAGGLRVVWLEAVKAGESLAVLDTLVKGTTRNGAVAAIALHADAGADRLLEGYAAAGQPFELREKAVFWLGAARGRRGYETLDKLVSQDSDAKLREKAVFALSVSKEPAAVDSMIRVARDDSSARVRGQALFWLGQKAGQKAAGALTSAIETDPDTDVKKKAVFALSRLPKEQGVPLLLDVARNNRNPEVRKQAFFWLGQSKDPKALEFFESVLAK